MDAVPKARRPLAVTLGVWRALFLREILVRMMRGRFAWLWMLIEPLAQVLVMLALFTLGLRSRTVAGGDVVVFLVVGILGFFLVRNVMNRGSGAIEANDDLYAFRQIKPIDVVFVKAMVEGLLGCLLLGVVLAGAGLAGHPVVPADPLAALLALFSLWLLGLGLALVLSVIDVLLPEVGRTIHLLQTPLYLLSGAMIPISSLPLAFRDLLLLNPVVHGLEPLRLAFMPAYHIVPGTDPMYLVDFAVVTIFLGLLLQVRFQRRLATGA
jgi:capsular polysaccharide transport system permease protein